MKDQSILPSFPCSRLIPLRRPTIPQSPMPMPTLIAGKQPKAVHTHVNARPTSTMTLICPGGPPPPLLHTHRPTRAWSRRLVLVRLCRPTSTTLTRSWVIKTLFGFIPAMHHVHNTILDGRILSPPPVVHYLLWHHGQSPPSRSV